MLVPSGGVAAAAGFRSSSSLSVSLQFPEGRVVRGLEADDRVRYDVESITAPQDAVSVTSQGRIIPSRRNLTGTVRIVVSFEGQNVTAAVNVTITNYFNMVVEANPYPVYQNSGAVAVTNLSIIEGVVPVRFERLFLSLRMHLLDGRSRLLTSGVSYTSTSGNETVNPTVNGRVLSVASSGFVHVVGTFAGSNSTQDLTVSALNSTVTVIALQRLRLNGAHATSTMVGVRRRTQGQIACDAVLSNQRIITDAVAADGTLNLPVFVFHSSNADVLEANNVTGQVILLNNYHSQVLIRATVGARNVTSNTLQVWANLSPAGGDVDLGNLYRAPVPSLGVGDTGRIPIRINTHGETLGTFQLRLSFNESALQVDTNVSNSVVYTVPPNRGTVDHATSVRTDEVRLTGTILNSRVRGPAEALAELRFTALQPGVHRVSGTIVMLENSDTSPQAIVENQVLVSGDIDILVEGSRRRRQVSELPIYTSDVAPDATPERMRQTDHNVYRASDPIRIQYRDRVRRQDCSEPVLGDTDGNSRFTAGDSLYVHYYVAARYQNFNTADGPEILSNIARCPSTELALDADQNGRISAVDAKFLLSVLDGSVFFVDLELASTNETESCAASMQATVSAPGDNLGFIRGVFFVIEHENREVLASSDVDSGILVVNDSTVVFEGTQINSTEVGTSVYEVSLITVGELTAAGVSVVVAVGGSDGLSAVLYPGPISSNMPHETLDISIPVQRDGAVSVKSIGSSGYASKLSFGPNPGTVECKTLLDICDELPGCTNDSYLNGTCTLYTESSCIARTVCDSASFEVAPPLDTEDRTCASSTLTTTLTTTQTTTITSSRTTTETTTGTTTATTSVSTTPTTTFPSGLDCLERECTVGAAHTGNTTSGLHVCKQALVVGVLDPSVEDLYTSLDDLRTVCIAHCDSNAWEVCAG